MWLQDAKACLLNHSSPWYMLSPCFSSTPTGSPTPVKGVKPVHALGCLFLHSLLQSTRHPCRQKSLSLCSTRCASRVSLKKVLTQVFSYKQKNNRRTTALKQHHLYWLAVSCRNLFSPKLQSLLFFFAFFVFQLGVSALFIL